MSASGSVTDTARFDDAVARAADWIVARVDDDGTPAGAAERNAWWRIPWALAVAGRRDAAAAVLAWAEEHALDADGDLRGGPVELEPGATPVYSLSALAIGAWLLGRYDLAHRIAGALRRYQDPETGGVWQLRDHGDLGEQDLLKTAQLGIGAVLMNDREVADRVHRFIVEQWALQPGGHVLYTARGSNGLITEADDPADRFRRIVDFSAPKQAYFFPGIAAAFLADYVRLTGDPASLDVARAYLQLNVEGTGRQYDDPTSVQICKFGWGVANMLVADPDGGHRPHAERMAEWFLDRQLPDGAWEPSTFGRDAPGDLDKLWKTAEHLMELAMLTSALATDRARTAAHRAA